MCSLRVFESVMYIAQQERDIRLGWDVWRDMREYGLRPPERVVSSMVDLAGHTRHWAMGKAVFEEYLSRLSDNDDVRGDGESEAPEPNVVISTQRLTRLSARRNRTPQREYLLKWVRAGAFLQRRKHTRH